MVDLVTGMFSFALAETMKVVRQALQMGSAMTPAAQPSTGPVKRALEYYTPSPSLSLTAQRPAAAAAAPHPIHPAPEHMPAPDHHSIAGFQVGAPPPTPGAPVHQGAVHVSAPAPPAAVYSPPPAQAPGWGPMP